MPDLVPLAFKTDPGLIRAVDAARGRVNRSQFIREAIAEKLEAMGRGVSDRLVYAPDRADRVAEGPAAALPAEKGKGEAVSYKAAAKAAKKAKAKGHAGESQKG